MPNFLRIVIELPTEYDTANLGTAKINDAIARVFPHDPALEAIKKAGGNVTVTAVNRAPPAPQNPPATPLAPAPAVATQEAPEPASKEGSAPVLKSTE